MKQSIGVWVFQGDFRREGLESEERFDEAFCSVAYSLSLIRNLFEVEYRGKWWAFFQKNLVK